MTTRLTLRIKKVYFDEILEGKKTSEYRANSDFYRNLIEKHPYTILRLHYQSVRQVECDIDRIRLIKNTLEPKLRAFINTKMIYEILIKNPRLINK